MVFPKVETEQNTFVLSRLHSKSVENTAFLETEVGITKSISPYVHFMYNSVTRYTLNFILGGIQMNKTIRIEALIDRTVECMLALGLIFMVVYTVGWKLYAVITVNTMKNTTVLPLWNNSFRS